MQGVIRRVFFRLFPRVEVATGNSCWELTGGPSSNGKLTGTKGMTVATCYNKPETMELMSTVGREMGTMLTPEELQLLASASTSGFIRVLPTNVVMAGVAFAVEGDSSVAEAYVKAVESLVSRGMVKRFAEGYYPLTPQGLEEAGKLPAENWQEVHRRFTGVIAFE